MRATAPAKIILFGEHAVVYGKPAIAVPISSLRATATYHPDTSGGLKIKAIDLDEVLPVDIDTELVDNALTVTARIVLRHLNIPLPNATVTVESEIPMASGLGSGAAVSTALARALMAGIGKEIRRDQLNQMIFEVEKIYHGTPSGIDNTVIVYEKPVYFIREKPIELLSIAKPFTVVIGDTGQSSLTRIAVGDVRKLYEANPDQITPILDQIGFIAQQARAAIESGNVHEIGPLMNQNHELLQHLTISSPELDQLVIAAREAGAKGAKLSGGGRGGNMIALVDDDTQEIVEDALIKAGAARVFHSRVG